MSRQKTIEAKGVYYKQLNEMIHAALAEGNTDLVLEGALGQRYIGVGLGPEVRITINGVPGNDLAAFMDGATIIVNHNVQDGICNTMNSGKVVVKGDAGDIISYGMRGGRLYIAGDVGYRTGIHMKSFQDQKPVVVIGGTAQDYLGEYMAGGLLVVLNLKDRPRPAGDFLGTGMHGGAIYVRGQVEPHQVGKEVGFAELDDAEWAELQEVLADFYAETQTKDPGFTRDQFSKLYPKSSRPYGNLYAY